GVLGQCQQFVVAQVIIIAHAPNSDGEFLTFCKARDEMSHLATTLAVQRSGVSSYRAGRQSASSPKNRAKTGALKGRLAHTLLTRLGSVEAGAPIGSVLFCL